MKTTTSLLLFALAGIASAQTRGFRPDYGGRIEGDYESFQRDGTIHRTLRLDRDGRVELTTETRGPRRDRDLEDRYGSVAAWATRREVRQTGRWWERDGRLRLRLDDGPLDDRRSGVDLSLERRGGDLVVRGDSDLYGREDIRFRPDDGWGGPRPWNDAPSRYGFMSLDRDDFRPIDTVDYEDVFGRARLKIRAGGRTILLHGKTDRRGDEVTFRVSSDGGKDGGRLTLLMDGGKIVAVRGRGDDDGRRFEIQ